MVARPESAPRSLARRDAPMGRRRAARRSVRRMAARQSAPDYLVVRQCAAAWLRRHLRAVLEVEQIESAARAAVPVWSRQAEAIQAAALFSPGIAHGAAVARAAVIAREAESRVPRLAAGPLAKQPVVPPEEPGARDAVEEARGGAAPRRVVVAAARDVGVEQLVAEAAPAVAVRRQGVAPDAAGEQPRVVRPSAAVLSVVA